MFAVWGLLPGFIRLVPIMLLFLIPVFLISVIGQPKRGDLSGIYGFNVKHKGINYEIAYTISEVDGKKVIVLLAGTRENFYEQLKRYIK